VPPVAERTLKSSARGRFANVRNLCVKRNAFVSIASTASGRGFCELVRLWFVRRADRKQEIFS
jgi:hypothetical protein